MSIVGALGGYQAYAAQQQAFGTRVEIVPENDAEADPRIPKDVLEALGPNDILASKLFHMLYIRQSHWDRIKDYFPPRGNQ